MTELEPGTVIYVRRPFVAAIADIFNGKLPEHFPMEYSHYGVYAGNDEVIHFVMSKGIQQVPLETFLENQPTSDCYERHFPQSKMALEIILKNRGISSSEFARILNEYHFYSAKETLRRAQSCINSPDWSYGPLGNNCEHFAIWCKTGIKYSAQVKDFFNSILS